MQVQAIDILRRVEKTLSIHFGLLSRLRDFPANWQQINKEQSKSAKTWEIWPFKTNKKNPIINNNKTSQGIQINKNS